MDKHFISANELLLDSFKLALQIYESGFRPHFIVGVWRGGAPVGIAVQEYLDYLGIGSDHIAIRTSSYKGIGMQNKEIRVHNLDYLASKINADDELLIVDDVFDSGRSIEAILIKLKQLARANCPKTIKVACPWYKPKRNSTEIEPNFYIHTTDQWLIFPHELQDLSLPEIEQGKGKEIAQLIEKASSSRR